MRLWRRRRGGEPPGEAPTLILPEGTRIGMDAHGQLSISAPGNLVIQSSGSYGTLESQGGSIRIDRAVEVEAVTVRCAETCYVQGRLTAWKVVARSLHLEESARVHVVLQETAHLEVGRDARLVGGFATSGELVGLFSRFARELRSLPFERRTPPAELPRTSGASHPSEIEVGEETLAAAATAAARMAGKEPPAGDEAALAAALSNLPEPLLFALVLLEREAERRIHPQAGQRTLEQMVKLLQEQDLETLRSTWRTLFGRIAEPREDVSRARELVAGYYLGEAGG
jgi:hypothetical protein